jgi:hypothetical protein
MDHCLSLKIMVLLGTMLANYSVPCHKGDGGNTLATRYNHKIILVDEGVLPKISRQFFFQKIPAGTLSPKNQKIWVVICLRRMLLLQEDFYWLLLARIFCHIASRSPLRRMLLLH